MYVVFNFVFCSCFYVNNIVLHLLLTLCFEKISGSLYAADKSKTSVGASNENPKPEFLFPFFKVLLSEKKKKKSTNENKIKSRQITLRMKTNTKQNTHGMNSELTDVKSELSSSSATSL